MDLTITSSKAAWTLIFISGLLEVAFALAVQASSGFTRWLPATLAIASGGLSVYLMSLSLAVIPIGTAYAVWGGIGAVGTAAIGLMFLGEPAAPMRLVCMALVIIGIIGLQLSESSI